MIQTEPNNVEGTVRLLWAFENHLVPVYFAPD